MDDTKHFDRLTGFVDDCYDSQEDDRKIHQRITALWAGENYPTKDGSKGIPTTIPLIGMAADAMTRHLISKAPRVLATPGPDTQQGWSENVEISTNKRIEISNLDDELAECARQSMTGYGTLFLAPQFVGTPDGMKLDLQTEAIDRADHVYDTYATRLEIADVQGHKFRLPIQDVRDNPLFDREVRMKVEATGEYDKEDSDTTNFRKDGRRRSDLYDQVEIWCMYERRRNVIWYYPRWQRGLLLRQAEWKGPRHGPYRYLYYKKPPNHAAPIAPLGGLVTKHLAFNKLDRKTINQQQVSKGLLLYSNASKEEAEEVVNATDNQSVLRENGAMQWTHVGGAAQDTVAMAEKQKRDFSYAAGNLDLMMGLNNMSPTLGQERLLAGAANQMLADMQGHAYKFVKGVAEDIFWFDIRDPNPEPMVLQKGVPGTDLSYVMPWTVEHRKAVMEAKFTIDVEPYSYVERDPETRLADLLGALQIMMGLRDDMVAQGITVDAHGVFRSIAKLKNLPDLYEWFVLNQDPQQLQQLLGQKSSPDPVDSMKPQGRYVRESRNDGSGKDMELLRMFGRNGQSQEVGVA